jgi:hypothetical protein
MLTGSALTRPISVLDGNGKLGSLAVDFELA